MKLSFLNLFFICSQSHTEHRQVFAIFPTRIKLILSNSANSTILLQTKFLPFDVIPKFNIPYSDLSCELKSKSLATASSHAESKSGSICARYSTNVLLCNLFTYGAGHLYEHEHLGSMIYQPYKMAASLKTWRWSIRSFSSLWKKKILSGSGSMGKGSLFVFVQKSILSTWTTLRFFVSTTLQMRQDSTRVWVGGFDKIKSLETSLRFPRASDPRVYNGFLLMRNGPTPILGGLKDSKITYDTSPSIIFQINFLGINLNRQFENLFLHLLESSKRPSNRQRDVIREEENRLA